MKVLIANLVNVWSLLILSKCTSIWRSKISILFFSINTNHCEMLCSFNRLVQAFHDVFSIVIFYQIGQSIIVLAVTVVSMAATESSPSVLIGKMMYLGIVFADIGLYCYLGHEVYYEVRFRTDNFHVNNNSKFLWISVDQTTNKSFQQWILALRFINQKDVSIPHSCDWTQAWNDFGKRMVPICS